MPGTVHGGMNRADLEGKGPRFLRAWRGNTTLRPGFAALRTGRNLISEYQLLKKILTLWTMEIEHGHKHFSDTDALAVCRTRARRGFLKLILFSIMARGNAQGAPADACQAILPVPQKGSLNTYFSRTLYEKSKRDVI